MGWRLRGIISYDTETETVLTEEGEKLVFVMGSFAYSTVYKKGGKIYISREKVKVSFDREEFVNQIISIVNKLLDVKDNCEVYIFAHNAGFDDRVSKLSTALRKAGFKLIFSKIDNRFVYVFERIDEEKFRKKVIMLDTMNFVQTSLSELAKVVNMRKLDFDTLQISRRRVELDAKFRRKLIRYNINDTLIVHKFAKYLVLTFKSCLMYTISSSTLCVFSKEHKEIMKEIRTFNIAVRKAKRELKRLEKKILEAGQSDDKKKLEKLIELFNKQRHITEMFEFFNRLARASYRGGRTEMFISGTLKDVKVVDVNSMYPFIMSTFPLPVGVLKVMKDIDYMDADEILMDIEEQNMLLKNSSEYQIDYIIDADFEIKPLDAKNGQIISPILINNNENRLMPVLGEVRAVLTSAELRAFKEYIKIKKIHSIAILLSKVLFKDFIEKLYEQRKKSKNEVMRTFYKLEMNSLSGKFAEKRTPFKTFFIDDETLKKFLSRLPVEKLEEFYTEGRVHASFTFKEFLFMFGEDLVKELFNIEEINSNMLSKTVSMTLHADSNIVELTTTAISYDSLHTFVPISSFITAYGRVYITKLIERVIQHKDAVVYYTDTDSLHVNSVGLEVLKQAGLINDGLGKLKIEAEAEYGVYIANKVYFLFDSVNTRHNELNFKLKKMAFRGIRADIILNLLPVLTSYDIKKVGGARLSDVVLEGSFFKKTALTQTQEAESGFVTADEVRTREYYELYSTLKNTFSVITYKRLTGVKETLRRRGQYDVYVEERTVFMNLTNTKSIAYKVNSYLDENSILVVEVHYKPINHIQLRQNEVIEYNKNFINSKLAQIEV